MFYECCDTVPVCSPVTAEFISDILQAETPNVQNDYTSWLVSSISCWSDCAM